MKTPVQCNNVFQMGAFEQYFPMMLFIILYKVVTKKAANGAARFRVS